MLGIAATMIRGLRQRLFLQKVKVGSHLWPASVGILSVDGFPINLFSRPRSRTISRMSVLIRGPALGDVVVALHFAIPKRNSKIVVVRLVPRACDRAFCGADNQWYRFCLRTALGSHQRVSWVQLAAASHKCCNWNSAAPLMKLAPAPRNSWQSFTRCGLHKTESWHLQMLDHTGLLTYENIPLKQKYHSRTTICIQRFAHPWPRRCTVRTIHIEGPRFTWNCLSNWTPTVGVQPW
jgi:hypothetical protein